MKTVLLIDSAGPRYFQRRENYWVPCAAPARKDRLWVLFDLPEETLESIDMPRLFGNDRSRYIERRLAASFQDSPYRCAFPLTGNAFSPGRMMLDGTSAAKELDNHLAGLDTTLVGIWGCAALLALMSKKSAPPDVMLVLPAAHQLRIVVMKNACPVLTRCVQHEGDSDAKEILLTRQYLENQRIFERGKAPPLLYLGDSAALVERLNKGGIQLLPPPKNFTPSAKSGWLHPLFERLTANPPCQLAPLPMRARHLSGMLGTLAYLGAAASLMTALFINESEIRAWLDLRERKDMFAADIDRASAERDRLADIIAQSGADPELVRKATQFEMQEIGAAPGARQFMRIAAAAIAKVPDARVGDLAFRVNQNPANNCATSGGGQTAPAAEDGAARHAEIAFGITLPAEAAPSAKHEMRKQIAASLAAIDGLKVLRSPLDHARTSVLKGGFSSAEESNEAWCVSIPWQPAAADTAGAP